MSKVINQIARVIKTGDGSSTIYLEGMDETYHSTNGALQESLHIFINEGLKKVHSDSIKILEIGFGTGLNAIMTLVHMGEEKIKYDTLEPFPLGKELISKLDFPSFLDSKFHEDFTLLHEVEWDLVHEIGGLMFCKHETTLQGFETEEKFDVIYFDAFAPSKQAEVWVLENLKKCYKYLNKGGFLVTYCASGQFKRNLKECGFVLEHPPGPKGKREMTRAVKK